jgi:hypothetical protein
MNNLDQLRERFEAYQTKTGMASFLHYVVDKNEYGYIQMQKDWRLYQAAHISAVKQCAEICHEVERNITSHLNADHASAYHVNNIKHSMLALLPKENSDE